MKNDEFACINHRGNIAVYIILELEQLNHEPHPLYTVNDVYDCNAMHILTKEALDEAKLFINDEEYDKLLKYVSDTYNMSLTVNYYE